MSQTAMLEVDQTRIKRNGHAGTLPGGFARTTIPAAGQRSRWALAHLATAAMLLITLGSVHLAFLHPRTAVNQPTAAPPFATTVPETLIDVTSDAMPSGNTAFAVALWHFRSGPSALTLVSSEGPKYVVADTGSIAVRFDKQDHELIAGDHLGVPPGPEVALRNTGTSDATAFVIDVAPNNEVMWWDWDADPTAITRGQPIYSNLDSFPAGPIRLVLERLTMSTGEVVSDIETSDLEWIGVVSGRLGLTLSGEDLPFGWESGLEKRFVGDQTLPQLQEGWQMTVRNAGDAPLILVRLRFASAGDLATPSVWASPASN